jgi:hypothetical protein
MVPGLRLTGRLQLGRQDQNMAASGTNAKSTNEGAVRFYERHGAKLVRNTDGSGNEEKLPDRLTRFRQAARPARVPKASIARAALVPLAP